MNTALLKALLICALNMPVAAIAQDALPSVGDYRFPRARPTPTARPAGPVDSEVPEVREIAPTAAPVETPEPAPVAADTPTPQPAPTSSVSSAARATAPATASPKPAAASVPFATSSAAQPTVFAPAPAASVTTPSTGPSASPVAAAEPSAPSENWRFHSAKQGAAEQGWGMWAWLTVAAFFLGGVLVFGVQRFLRQRDQRAAWVATANQNFDDVPPQPAQSALTEPVTAPLELEIKPVPVEQSAPVFFAPSEPEPEPRSKLAPLPEVPEPAFAQLAAPQTMVGPLGLALSARRMSATLMNTVLNYELVVSNNGDEAIGPIHIGGDMISAHASLPTRSQLELTGQSIAPLHSLPTLAPGQSTTLQGELRLALSAITPIRSGNASLFVPLARFRVEALRKGAPPLVLNHTSVIGESQHAPGSALKPFRLDLGPRLYSDISQRELALA